MSQTLIELLVEKLTSLEDARNRAVSSLDYLAGLGWRDLAVGDGDVVLRTVVIDGEDVPLRPINLELFIGCSEDYEVAFAEFREVVADLGAHRGNFALSAKNELRSSLLISRVLYTTLQAIGCAMDCVLMPNAARKNYGMRFEELMSCLLASLGIGQNSIQLSLPYLNAAGDESKFTNQVDLVIGKNIEIDSRVDCLAESEVVVSVKTSSKDRFSKIFLDQEMLSYVTGRPIKVVALFHNDIQRSGSARTSVTFVAGNFAAYVARFGELAGVYYVDPPPHIERHPWNAWLRRFEDLLLEDLWSRIF